MRRYSREYRRRPRVIAGRRVLIGVGVVLPTFLAVALCTALVTRRHSEPLGVRRGSAVAGASAAEAASLGPAAPSTRADPALLVLAGRSLRPAETQALARATRATRAVAVDAAELSVGPTGTRTEAVGVDPRVFRWVMPAPTAASAELWRRISAGDGAVSPTLDGALSAGLGGGVAVRAVASRDGRSVMVPVGAVAGTDLPGVGLVLDHRRSAAVGLVPSAGLVLVVPSNRDPLVLAAAAEQAVPGVQARSLRRVADGGVR